MTLREPAGTLWRKHREAIARIARAPGGESNVLLGGGAILAARWAHRRSTTIEVLLPERTALYDVGRGGTVDLERATGGEVVENDGWRIVLKVDEGKLDIAAIRPELPGLETITKVEGQAQAVLGNEQILRGKLNRTEEGIARDAFDFAVARRVDPRALEIAANSFSEGANRVIQHNLRTGNGDMAREAEAELEGVAPEHEECRQALAELGADAVAASRYKEVRIAVRQGRIHIATQAVAGTIRSETYDGRRPAEALRKAGMDAYLESNSNEPPGGVARELQERIRNGRDGTVLRASRSNGIRRGRTWPGSCATTTREGNRHQPAADTKAGTGGRTAENAGRGRARGEGGEPPMTPATRRREPRESGKRRGRRRSN